MKYCEICSKLTIKTAERRHWSRSCVVIVNFEHISHLFFWCFYCWTAKCLLGSTVKLNVCSANFIYATIYLHETQNLHVSNHWVYYQNHIRLLEFLLESLLSFLINFTNDGTKHACVIHFREKLSKKKSHKAVDVIRHFKFFSLQFAEVSWLNMY